MSLGRGLAVVGRPCRCGEAEGRNEGDRKRLHGHHEYPLTEWRGIAGSGATLPRAEQTRSLNQPRFMGGSGSGAKFLPASTVVADQKLGSSEERRVGQKCVSPCRCKGWQYQ